MNTAEVHARICLGVDDLARRLEEANERFGRIAGKAGAFMDPPDVALTKILERLDFGPAREYPIKLPDGVVYWGPGSTQYPKEHEYARMSAALQELAADSLQACERIETLVGERFVGLRMKKGWP